MAPVYSPIMAMIQRDMSYTVKVGVKINEAGVVTTAKALDGHPAFSKPSEDAAIRWRFSPDSEVKERVAEIMFVYHLIDWESGAAALTPVFTLPNKVEVKRQLKVEVLPNVRPSS